MSLINKLKRNRFVPSFGIHLYRYAKYVITRIETIGKPNSELSFPIERVSPKDGHYFFGYYDKSPWNSTGRFMLSLKIEFAKRMPRKGEPATVCLVDLENENNLMIVGESSAWCWQQGCMLQWVVYGDKQRILYNDYQDGRYVTVIKDINGCEIDVLPIPTYCVSKDGRYIISLNFNRLHYCRPGYGYVAENYRTDNPAPEDDGLFLYDLNTKEKKLIVPLSHILQFNPREEFEESFHYFNHVEFNPCGNRVVFYHRWKSRATGVEKTRMYTAAPDGSDLYCLSDHDMVSHYTWKDDNHLLAWAAHPLAGQRYYLYEDKTDHVIVVGGGVLDEDGHPSYSADGRWIVTDTYPDSKRRRTLLIFDTQTLKCHNIGKFFVPFPFDGPIRCDLHPRWDNDETKICIDSVHEGNRSIYVVDVTSIVM